MNFFVTVLGSGSALPTASRHCSAQVVNINGFRILLDCGEATQTQIRVFHQRLQSIGQIFLTHLHGDHFFGLPGLVSSMHLCGRSEPLDIYAPTGIADAVTATSQKVSVYTLAGQLLRSGVDRSRATLGLPAGIYVVGGKKVLVR